jgi:antitoxin PrlF
VASSPVSRVSEFIDLPVETAQHRAMPTLLVSSKGRIVLPAGTRRRLGLCPGTRLELTEETDGIRLKVVRSVPAADLVPLAGLVKAKSKGRPRRLEEFDSAQLMKRSAVR